MTGGSKDDGRSKGLPLFQPLSTQEGYLASLRGDKLLFVVALA